MIYTKNDDKEGKKRYKNGGSIIPCERLQAVKRAL